MKVEVHILAFDEALILPYAIRHYATYADKIVVHDGGQNADIPSPAIVEAWDTNGEMDDIACVEMKNGCWKGTDADWVICADADELIYFPEGEQKTLATYEARGAAMIKPHGIEMFSEVFPDGPGQIYDYVKDGAPDDVWYAKPILFSPKRVVDSGFGIGAHEADPVFKGKRQRMHVGPAWANANPPCLLLHFHQIGPKERVGARYDAVTARLSTHNRRMGWGKRAAGIIHAQEKRDLICPHLRRVIP